MSNLLFWFIQIPGWALCLYLVVAQCIPAINYELGVKMGTQEPESSVTPVGVAFWKGFCGADLLIYVPLLALGLIGHLTGRSWGETAMAAALGITVYWPMVCLWTIAAARNAKGWRLENELLYWMVLPTISMWGAAALFALQFAAKP